MLKFQPIILICFLFIKLTYAEDPKISPSPAPIGISKMKSHEGWFVGLRGAYVPSGIVEIGYEFNNTFKLRLLGQVGRYNKSYGVDGQQYNGIKFQPGKVGLMADWHPWKNGFHLSGGVAYNTDVFNA